MNDISASMNKKWKITGSILLVLIAAGIISGIWLYRFIAVPRGFTWLYPFTEPLLYGIALAGLCLAAVLWLPLKQNIKWILIFVCGAGCGILVFLSSSFSTKNTVIKVSPGFQHQLVLEENSLDGTVKVYQTYFLLFKKERDTFPYPSIGKKKYQWLQKDVCAITYQSPDREVHQYLATFGSRGNDISYLDPLTAVMGNWKAQDSKSDGLWLTIEGGVTVLQKDGQSFEFEDADCVRFGTSAIALCKNGLPQWSVILNQDCKINYTNMVARGGTLTLCPVAMEKTEPVKLASMDEKPVYAKTDPALAATEEDRQEEKLKAEIETIKYLRDCAKNNVSEQDLKEGALGVFYVPIQDEEELWNVREALKSYEQEFRVNGVDSRIQIDSIQRLSGDTDDGLYEVTFTNLCISPGNQGSSPESESVQMTYKIRLVKSTQGYYGVVFHFDNNGTYGLSGGSKEKYTLNDKEEYHFFLAGEYDTTYIYVGTRRSPEEAMQVAYDKELAAAYPGASAAEYDGMPYMNLSGDGKILLLYDGISEDCQNYCFQAVTLDKPGPEPGSKTMVQGTYQVPLHK